MTPNVRDKTLRSTKKKCIPCAEKSPSRREPMVRKSPQTKAEVHHGQCMIHVAAHWRGCSSKTAAKVKPAKRRRA